MHLCVCKLCKSTFIFVVGCDGSLFSLSYTCTGQEVDAWCIDKTYSSTRCMVGRAVGKPTVLICYWSGKALGKLQTQQCVDSISVVDLGNTGHPSSDAVIGPTLAVITHTAETERDGEIAVCVKALFHNVSFIGWRNAGSVPGPERERAGGVGAGWSGAGGR